MDGRVLDIAADGSCVLAGPGAGPGRGPKRRLLVKWPRTAARQGGRSGGREGAAKRCDRFEQFAAVAPEDYAQIPEILCRELGQRLPIDLVVVERDRVSLETQAAQPLCYVQQAPLSSSSNAFASLRSGVAKPSVNQL